MRHAVLLLLFSLLPAAGPSRAADRLAVSYIRAPFNLQLMVMKERRLLEKRLEPLGVTVEWTEFVAGPRQVQALAAGDLDVAGVMNTSSLLMAAGEGVALKIIAGVARPARIFAVVGGRDGPRTPGDLRGKTVAGPPGTVLHQLLAAVLAREGLGMADVRLVGMSQPQAFAALRGGRVDAALLSAGLMAGALEEGASLVATAQGSMTPKLAVVATAALVNRHPGRVRAVVQAHDEAWEWIAANHDAAIALAAQELGISAAAAEQFFGWYDFTQRLTRDDEKTMAEDMRFLLENRIVRREVAIPELFYPEPAS